MEGGGRIEDADRICFAFMGATQIELAFVTAPDMPSYADVKGKSWRSTR